MYIAQGHRRIVLVIPRLGIVLKFPIIRINVFLSDGLFVIKRRNFRNFIKWLFVYTPDQYFGARNRLFGGIVDNQREYWLSTYYPMQIIQPTYFSFFGLINIQKAGEPLDQTEATDFFSFLLQYVKDKHEDYRLLFSLGHHIEIVNFCTNNDDSIRIVDYGNPRLWWYLMLYGDQIIEDYKAIFKHDTP